MVHLYHCQGLNVVKPVYNGSQVATANILAVHYIFLSIEMERARTRLKVDALTSRNHSSR